MQPLNRLRSSFGSELLRGQVTQCLALAAQTTERFYQVISSGYSSTSYSQHHFNTVSSRGMSSKASQDSKNLNRLLYRARQRGWLELDLLVGMWVEREAPRLAPPLLDDLEALLQEENPDLFKWLTGQLPPPEDLVSNKAYQMIRKEVDAALQAKGALGAAAPTGREWVRGWDDGNASSKDIKG